jgi:hypothetical protein
MFQLNHVKLQYNPYIILYFISFKIEVIYIQIMYMNYVLIADVLWYVGHMLTGCAILITKDHYSLAVGCVWVGQGMTMISRPIGRIHIPEPKLPEYDLGIKL